MASSQPSGQPSFDLRTLPARPSRRTDAHRCLNAARKLPGRCLKASKKHRKFMHFSNFRCHTKNLFVTRKFAQRIESHQRHHKSIAFCLRKGGKLPRIKTNSLIRSYDRFCDLTARKKTLSIRAQFALCKSITLRAEGLYESLGAGGKPSTWVTARDDS